MRAVFVFTAAVCARAWLAPRRRAVTHAPRRASEDAAAIEDAAIGLRRFGETIDAAPGTAPTWDLMYPTFLVTVALIAPQEWLIAAGFYANGLGLLATETSAPDAVRLVAATIALAALWRGDAGEPFRAAVFVSLVTSRLVVNDDALPVRVAARYEDDETKKALSARRASAGAIGATYVVAAAFYAHGVVQPFLNDVALRAASVVAIASMPEDPEATVWWPAVASLSALAPVAAAGATAIVSYAAERALLAPWRPTVASGADVDVVCAREARVFALNAPPKRAERRAASFRAAACDYNADRKGEDLSAIARAVASAAAAAASGTFLAPYLARALAYGIACRSAVGEAPPQGPSRR